MTKFSTNPIFFKILYINRDRFETTMNISGVIGKAFHLAMEVYSGGSDTLIPSNESEAIEYGLKAGMEYLEKYNDGFIKFSETIPNKQKAFELFALAFNSYVVEIPYKKDIILGIEEEIAEYIDVEWRGEQLTLPVKLKGRLDKIEEEDGKIRIIDYKTCSKYSDPERIDGAKMLQAVEYYLLAYAKYGKEPYSLIFDEIKYVKNRDGSKQTKRYEIVFKDNELYFDFYFRFYEDMTRALNGEQVYVPNVHTLYDNELSIIWYIHRLDVPEEQAKLMKKHKVSNVTDLLKKQLQSAANMRKLLKTVESEFAEAKNIDYSHMKTEEKIKTKMMEHGMILDFADMKHGASVDLYRFSPSIGLKMSKVKNYVDDVEQVLGISGVRILAPIPDTSFIGFEVPKEARRFPAVPGNDGFNIAIGETTMGEIRKIDIRTAPHLLVAGASGSGKSVFLGTLITQLFSAPHSRLHLFDPKMVELALYKNGPNIAQYLSDAEKIKIALNLMIETMNKRYEMLEAQGARNIEEVSGSMTYEFVFLDEFADLIMQDSGEHSEWQFCENHSKLNFRGGLSKLMTTKKKLRKKEIEIKESVEDCEECKEHVYRSVSDAILMLAQKGRAAGIHVVISTQSPRTDIIRGSIKANFPVKAVFRTAKMVDSQVVIDEPGAEKLLGKGDMLFMGDRGIERLQGFNV